MQVPGALIHGRGARVESRSRRAALPDAPSRGARQHGEMTKTLLLALIAFVGAPAVASAHPAAGSRPARCTAPRLVVWLDTNGNGAAGSSFYPLELTNLSARPCTLRGYPGVSAIDLRSRQIGSAAGRDHRHAPRTVTLAPGASASATLQITQAANYPAARCHRVRAAGLRVYPPGSRQAKLVPFPFSTCARRGVEILHVGVVLPH
jgi:hypothetical protein